MLNEFMKNFEPAILSEEQLIQQVSAVTPIICSLSDEDQIMHWEFIGNKITKEQQKLLSRSINHLLVTEKNKNNYAEGILLYSFDVSEFNLSLKKLKAIENPDANVKSAIKSMEAVQKLLEQEQPVRKPKM